MTTHALPGRPPRQTITVAAAIDDSFAVPLLVMLRSAGKRLSTGWDMDVQIIGNKIQDGSKARVESGLADLPIRVSWRTLDLSHVRDHWPGTQREGDLAIYSRLYLGETLPESVERVLFLDADLLVEGDLAELWQLPFDGHLLQAVPDSYADALHTPRLRKIRSPDDVQFEKGTPYFNAGLQLIDLKRWREENVASHTESLLWEHGDQFFMREQDALNVALKGRWKVLPPAWNFHELPHLLSQWNTQGLSQSELRQTFHHPKIIHFIGRKPWDARCSHVHRDRWWKVAREVHVPEPDLPLTGRFWHRYMRDPHARLHWHVWRDILQAPDLSRWRRAAAVLLRNPWMLFTYPAWLAANRIRLQWKLSRTPKR